MRSILAALTAVLLGVAAPGQPPAKTIPIPNPNVPGGKVVLVPRDQLRAGPNIKRAVLPHALRAQVQANAIPIPASWDWSKGGAVKLPMLGNDQYGDCYYVTLCKMFLLYFGNVKDAPPLSFSTADVVKRYKQLSGGDNGLSDGDVFPEIKSGVIGPNGPHKARDVLVIPASDKAALDLTGWAFGPHMFTFTVYSNFGNGAKPGVTFDTSSGQVEGGHAVPLSGKDANGNWLLETWAMQPSIHVTPHWVSTVDPEFISVFSDEWFDKNGFAPNGQHYQTLAGIWNSIGGHVDPVGPFPPPTGTGPTAKLTANPATVMPGGSSVLSWATTNAMAVALNGTPVSATGTQAVSPSATTAYTLTAIGVAGTTPATQTVTVAVGNPPPPPPVGKGFTGTLTYVDGVLVSVGPVGPPPPPPAELDAAALTEAIKAGKVSPLVIFMDALQIYTDYQAKNYAAVAVDVAKLIADLKGVTPAPMSAAPMPAEGLAAVAAVAAAACCGVSADGCKAAGCVCTDGCKCQGACPGSCPTAPKAAEVSYAEAVAAVERGETVTVFYQCGPDKDVAGKFAVCRELAPKYGPGRYVARKDAFGRRVVDPVRLLAIPAVRLVLPSFGQS